MAADARPPSAAADPAAQGRKPFDQRPAEADVPRWRGRPFAAVVLS
jgi:hypothetical protein